MLSGALTVGAGASIDVSGCGYAGQSVFPGGADTAPTSFGNVNDFPSEVTFTHTGGTGGGRGGGNSSRVWGDPLQPFHLGGGGGRGDSNAEPGGNGGGRVRIVAQSMDLAGSIEASGETGTVNGAGGGGGTVLLEASDVSVTGTIDAAGGAGGSAGGGGGRVRISSDIASAVLGQIDVSGGDGPEPGTVGTVATGASKITVVLDGGGGHPAQLLPYVGTIHGASQYQTGVSASGGIVGWMSGALVGRTLVCPAFTDVISKNSQFALYFETADPQLLVQTDQCRGQYAAPINLVITSGTVAAVDDHLLIDSLVIEAGGVLTHTPAVPSGGDAAVYVTTTGDIVIPAGAAVDVVGAGYPDEYAPGPNGSQAFSGSSAGSGGSHAGLGAGPAPNAVYGNGAGPMQCGSGGSASGGNPGGAGGGVVRLEAGGVLTIDGLIDASGADAPGAGAGAGGSIWLVGNITGAGQALAEGGDGANGGGGGRIKGAGDLGSSSVLGGNGAEPGTKQ